MSDTLADLSAAGVAVWLDDLSRERLRTGNLQRLIDEKHVVGVTTNPTIFQKAMAQGDAYDEQLGELALRKADVGEAVHELTTYAGADASYDQADLLHQVGALRRVRVAVLLHRVRPAAAQLVDEGTVHPVV